MAIDKLVAGILGPPSHNRGVSGELAPTDANPLVKKAADQPGARATGKTDDIKLSSRVGAGLRAVSEDYAGHARDVREADVTLEKAGQQLSQMKGQLESIVKNFPPFDSESRERVNYLNTFAGLRRQYELLTIPPIEPRWPPQFVFSGDKEGQPVVDLGNGVQSEFPPGLVKTPELPQIPSVDKKMSDEQLAEVSKQIGEAYEALVAARQKLRDGLDAELSTRKLSGVDAQVAKEGEAVSLSESVRVELSNNPSGLA